MSSQESHPFQVVIAGAGVAGLEGALALRDLAPESVRIAFLVPTEEFVYRPMTVREPFAYPRAQRYPLAPILADLGAELFADALVRVDTAKRLIHTTGGAQLHYDALLLALGAQAKPRYAHALTVDDRRLDETLQGLLQDIEGGYTRSIAFVSPGRMPWQLPIYELAMMTAGRAYDMGVELQCTIVTPEDSPLAIFGSAASSAVAELLERARVKSIHSAYAEVPHAGEVVINPGDRRLKVDRVVALPELYGPPLRGIPLGEHGFIRTDQHSRVPDAGPVFAAGDAVEFPIKHGGLSAQQADAAAESIAALAGAPIEPKPFHPIIHGMLLTDERPRYLTAHITGGHGFSSQITETPTWSPPRKIVARYLAPYLEQRDREALHAQP